MESDLLEVRKSLFIFAWSDALPYPLATTDAVGFALHSQVMRVWTATKVNIASYDVLGFITLYRELR